MTETVIRVDNLGKLYKIGERQRYHSLRDTFANALSGPFKWLTSLRQSARPVNGIEHQAKGNKRNDTDNTFWALKDVSFEVKRAEVIGIIGRNGAGKSTLLKILSRITEPTTGTIEINGRVGSLLEIGTGFHPELTGRENVYLNGAILGMKRIEIVRKFDEIVAFAEVDKFLDTPVKHFSSGMYMRLAFAVAAYMEPEILVVDEVLAVGDAAFQKKCLGKMSDVANQGRTVLFVSHNMAAIQNFCTTAMEINQGTVRWRGPTAEVVSRYVRSLASESPNADYVNDQETSGPAFRGIRLVRRAISYGDVLSVEIHLTSNTHTAAAIEIEIHDEGGIPIIYSSTSPMYGKMLPINAEGQSYTLQLGPLFLASGDYDLFFWLIHPWTEFYHTVKTPLRFTVGHSDPGDSGFDFRQAYGRGAITIPFKWEPITTGN